MKILITLFAFAFVLRAEDAAPKPSIERDCANGPTFTLNSEGCKAALKELAMSTPEMQQFQKQIAELAAELRLYQQGLFQCQAAEIHQQAVQQSQQTRLLEKTETKK